ncbi:DUF1707 domain-containing protein [Streptomyces sp. NPDC059740]|uniref:DUF1707 SHOCT-like domain-containing protein n=1 Tax=Streptomyces sp. NPDC059740 TaxID=3346926 RepID=UPI00365B6590
MDESPRTSSAPQPVDLTKRATAPAPTAELRASDADRDRVAEILREALAQGRLDAEEHAERLDRLYRSKTVGELQPLVRDLPDVAAGAPKAAARPVAPTGPVTTQNLVAVFSANTRKGRWRAPSVINATAVFGSVEIDLTEAVFTQQQIVINCRSVLGSVEVRVPENVTLRSQGAGVLGAFEVDVNDSLEEDAPVVVVNGFAVLGSVEAKPKRGKWVHDLLDRALDVHERVERRREERYERWAELHERHAERHAERHERHAERRERRRAGGRWER